MNIKKMLEKMIGEKGSDLHLKAGLQPVIRVDGLLRHLDFQRPSPKDMESVAEQILTPTQREKFRRTKEVDFAFGVAGLARFRANFYIQRGSIAMVFRHVPVEILSVDELYLPESIKDLALKQRGLIFVTGTVGSGKSTTLAAMIINVRSFYNQGSYLLLVVGGVVLLLALWLIVEGVLRFTRGRDEAVESLQEALH